MLVNPQSMSLFFKLSCRQWLRPVGNGLALGAALMIAGCWSDATVPECMPDSADAGIATHVRKPTVQERGKGDIDLYMDASATMKGYLVPNIANATYADVALTLPQILQPMAGKVNYHRFGSIIQDLDLNKVSGAAQPAFYGDRKINQTSDIGRVLERVAEG